jgi:hypothetical protein
MVFIHYQISIIVKHNIFSPSRQKLAIKKINLKYKKSTLLTMVKFPFFFQIYVFKNQSIQLEVL